MLDTLVVVSARSNRQARAAFAAAAAIAMWWFACTAWAADKLEAVRVAPDVWFVEGEAAMGSSANRNFVSNAGFVVTDAGVVVIDALGSPSLAEALIAEIRRVTRQPIRFLIVTHFHADHIYSLQALVAAGARILAHPAGREYLVSEGAQRRLEASRQELFPWIDENTRLVAADQWLVEQETVLRVGRHRFRIRHAGPAHTPEDLELTRDYLVHLRQVMGRAARDLEPFDDAHAKADWSRFAYLPLFRAVNRMNAYNTYLLMEQQER